MSAKSHFRGHPIYFDGEYWRYEDDKSKVMNFWEERPCGYCGKDSTPEGHDGCLGTLIGVVNACCGHGNNKDAYIQYPDGSDVRDKDALLVFTELRKGPEFIKSRLKQ